MQKYLEVLGNFTRKIVWDVFIYKQHVSQHTCIHHQRWKVATKVSEIREKPLIELKFVTCMWRLQHSALQHRIYSKCPKIVCLGTYNRKRCHDFEREGHQRMTGIKDDHFIILKCLTECKHFLYNEMMKAKYFHMECYVLKKLEHFKNITASFNKHSQTLWGGG